MSSTVTEVSKDILPDEKLDCVVYGCTSGTIAVGYEEIKKKIIAIGGVGVSPESDKELTL